MVWFLGLLIGLLLEVVAYLILPKPQQQKPPAAQDADNPVAEAGKPIPVVFGTMTVQGLNILWYGDKSKRTYSVSA